MKSFVAALAVSALCLSGVAFADNAAPYAGLQTRAVKALSDRQIEDLREGRGAGFALAAELNGYPGPLHVLELGDRLGLDARQRQRTQKLFDAMKDETKPLGQTLVRQEAELDRLFATRTIAEASLETATTSIAETQGRLRAAHLRYHLAMMDVLRLDQISRYAELRGYGSGHSAPKHGGHGMHPK